MHALQEFERLDLGALYRRRSEKWRLYPRDVLPAFVAEMDFALADPIREALERAIAESDCGYACVRLLPEVVAAYLRRDFGLQVEPNRVFTVPDVMAGVAQALDVLTPAHSAIAINPPVYPPFFEVIATIGRTVVEVPLRQDGDVWQLDLDALESAFASGVRGFLLCSPHNPVGRVWTAAELDAIAALAHRYGVAVVADEIHAPLTMPGVPFVSFLARAIGEQPCVCVVSASKGWNVAGLKCAALVAGTPLVRSVIAERFRTIHTEIAARVGHLGIVATVAAFEEGGAWLEGLRAQLDRNRRLLGELLDEKLPQLRYTMPDATYLAWIDCSALGLGSDPSRRFLERGRVALAPGPRFGAPGRGFVRLTFATSSAILTEIVERMAAALP